jgi:hypothetical protein
VSKRDRGSDDPRNGLVLCALHHRAFDAELFGIEPQSLAIRYRDEGPSATELRITKSDLGALRLKPHQEAIAARWRSWGKKPTRGELPA